ncbi:MAG: T9SS type A sorting domain-containing protein [Bacteroidia bacterium]
MKKIFTILFVCSLLLTFAQGPVIEGTYLPVRGTAVTEIWDISSGTIEVPSPSVGPNDPQFWDYSDDFDNPTAPYRIETFIPDTTPYFSNFTDATHGSFLSAPIGQIDSLYSYYVVDTGGLYMIGGRSVKAVPSSGDYFMNDTTATYVKRELYIPANVYYQRVINDTSIVITYASTSGILLKIKSTKYKHMTAVGYGTLKMPDGRVYNDVLLTKVDVTRIDSAFLASNGMFLAVPGNPDISNFVEYSFLRNNTFGSSALMYLDANQGSTAINYGWYTTPVDFGSISGTVYTDDTENTAVAHGEARLYRENSNFTKHDILDRTPLDSNGNFKFDSIPYGIYRVAIRPDTSYYQHAITTYFGDTTNWEAAQQIITFNDSTSDGHKIHLRHYPDLVGTNQIQGILQWNLDIRSNQPIPGIDVVVRKKPAGNALRVPRSDSTGTFFINGLPDGDYSLFVDIPGCTHATTYNFCVYGGEVLNTLDYQCGTDSLHILNPAAYGCNTSTSEINQSNVLEVLKAYPNPYSSSTIINVNIFKTSDVKLEVCSLLGEKVQTLENGLKQAGNYSYTFSAIANHYPAGLYFVRLIVDRRVSVLKIVEL